jgi:uracil-DNA glycosylase
MIDFIPPRDCPLCPRLVAYRQNLRMQHPGWHNAPVPQLGPLDARLLIVGLAPSAAGANRTGRKYTGAYAGTLLYPALLAAGFARVHYDP